MLDRTLLFTSPLLLTIGFAAAHREERKKKRNVVVVLLQPGCERVFVCALVCILVRQFSRILSSQGIGGTHRKKKTARIETETNRTEKSIPLRVNREFSS